MEKNILVREKFSLIPNAIFSDIKLSFSARTLLAFLYTVSDDWNFDTELLSKILGFKSKNELIKSFNELIKNGWILREKEKDGRNILNKYKLLISPIYIDNDSTNKELMKQSRGEQFTPPTLEEIRQYIIETNASVDAEKFYYYYESIGWLVGKSKMKNWKMAIKTWERNGNKYSTKTKQSTAFF